jgi:hypothetical protein
MLAIRLSLAGRHSQLLVKRNNKACNINMGWMFKSPLRHPSNHLIALAYMLDFLLCVPGVLSLVRILCGAAERSPTFKGHHFSSLGAHKELELFLRENLSNNFRMLDSRKWLTAVKLFGETMLVSTPSLNTANRRSR